MRARHLTWLAVLASLLVVGPVMATPAPPAVTPGADPRRAAGGSDGARVRAERALEAAKRLFSRAGPRRGDGGVDRTDPTMVLRELALRLRDLKGEDRTAAEQLLARPTGGGDPTGGYEHAYTATPRKTCTKNFCFFWVDPLDAPSNRDRVPRANGDDARVPRWVRANIAAFKTVRKREVGELGFRAPRPDTKSPASPNKKFDIYLQQLGNLGIYGLCTSDDPAMDDRRPPARVSAYCVLDNDMAEFSAGPAKSLKVTAAHEFFHTLQYNYDWREDTWLMEGTATWVEDEVFDDINDNYQFLKGSPLTSPTAPVDRGSNPYGSWIFWRFLTEYFASGGADASPGLIRRVWSEADGSKGYSAQAAARVARAEGTDLPRAFAAFSVWNRSPGSRYSEGKQYAASGFTAPLARTVKLSTSRPATKQQSTRLDHLTSSTVRYDPDNTLAGRRWKLRLSVDMAPKSRGSRAAVTLRRKNGSAKTAYVDLDTRGDGSYAVPFTSSRVSAVELTLVNGSTRFSCNRGTRFSCRGKPKDDDLRAVFRATAFR